MADKIFAYLEGKLDQYLDDLNTLVSIDSGSRDKDGVDEVNDWLVERLEKVGFEVERHPQENYGDDLVATLNGTGKARVMLLGHTDTVYPKGTTAERPMTIDGDTILGPGTCDMKAGLLTGLYAVEALKEAGFEDFQQITYVTVSDEEIEDRHSHELIQRVGKSADAALTLEAARANGDIVTARKGVHWYTVEAFGRSAHAGVEPEKGRSAIVALAQHIVELDKLNGYRPDVTVNIGIIEGGMVPNAVPEHAMCKMDVRAFTNEDLDATVEAIKKQLEKPTIPDVEIKISKEGLGSPTMPRTPEVAALEALAQQAAKELGFEVNGAKTGGGSDASIVAAEGTPVLDGLGPIGGLDHGPDEYIEKSSIVPRTAMLAKLMMAIAQRTKE